MVIVYAWAHLMLVAAMATSVCATSMAHTVFPSSDNLLNPFNDRFIQRIVHMDRKKFHAITEMDVSEIHLAELMKNDNALDGLSTRQSKVDPYESILNDKLDDQLALQDNIDSEWVHLMTAGPLAINFVSHLLAVGSKRDFPLTRPPKFVFQHIKHPDSFRATLAQVSGSMYSALIDAHTAMDHIQLNVQQVPGQIKTALKLVLAGTPLLIKIMLPPTLQSIYQTANASATHARSTFNKFVSLQELLAEIIEASTNTRSTQSVIVDQIKSKMNESKLQEDLLQKNINSISAQYQDARREMEKARKEHEEAKNAIPNARKRVKRFLGRFFRRLFKAVVSFITAPLRIIGCILGFCHTDRGAYETARQNAIAKANLLRQTLENAERRYAEFAKQQEAEQQKLIDIIKRISALDLNRMSEEEILDILVDSLYHMNDIKEQWGRLIQFFSKLSVQADSTQQIVVHELIDIIQNGQANDLLLDPTDREFFAEILSELCQEIERGAHLLYVMSKTYYDISAEYMINQIASMQGLLLLQTDNERSSHLISLDANMTSTATRIMQLAQERQMEYHLRNKARRDEFERFLANVPEIELELSVV